ncbi:DUF3348 domain-containing protein [Dyella sp. BiH032]|uniref:DUF3348 domain-containing protein n=1 Tax=Dyella sp. BiH032 TaxID=3075430 RepID=UPI002893096D|nr:DUF3348 domain-containing protein [Dyella sp. BiH032]WNL48260.1 DUF3348 domain-containing protein [Dyella sp. BiH032]
MVQAPRRTVVRGPTFVRLLARLADGAVASAAPPLADRLSQWLDWNQAIALSTALDGKPAGTTFPGSPAGDEVEAEACVHARTSLTQAIAQAPELAAPAAGKGDDAAAGPNAIAEADLDYAVFRQRYLTLQRAMQAATGRLRGRLRDRLAQRSTELARLADVDAVMEQALSPREQTLFATIPTILGTHFERLREAAHAASPEDAVPAGAWLDVFRKDMQSVLLAELDVRFQPVEGLLAALRAS